MLKEVYDQKIQPIVKNSNAMKFEDPINDEIMINLDINNIKNILKFELSEEHLKQCYQKSYKVAN